MILHSTVGASPKVSLAEGVANGIAPDGGLYMPDVIPRLPAAFFNNIHEMTLKEIAFVVCDTLFGRTIPSAKLKAIVDGALDFDIPLQRLSETGYVLEMFHGPTLSFKDIGARFMSRLLQALLPAREHRDIILATSGDSGGAVANAFSNNAETKVYVLFPKEELSRSQVAQFSSLSNVIAVEVDGTFDDCQALVKEALHDDAAHAKGRLTSGNSINLARELPLIICFFQTYARIQEATCGEASRVVVSIPCGNLGTLVAALMAKKMGLPVHRFIAANNANDVFVEYLKTGGFRPQRALLTLARAMDVGNPSNIARIIDLCGGDPSILRQDVEGYAYSDGEIAATMREVHVRHGMLIDPQGATALRAAMRHIGADEISVTLVGAHPVKFADVVEAVTGCLPKYPEGYVPEPPCRRIHKIPPTLGALNRLLGSR